ncbi:MAG: endonuclease/exonuclease/phosphatase family protein [Actinomycetota bacterium]
MRVVVWNLWWEFTHPDDRYVAATDVLLDLAPDVVLLQEVAPDRADALAARLGGTAAWGGGLVAPDRFPPGPHEVPFGNAVVSRWPILDSVVVPLPKPPHDGGTRQIVAARIDEPGGPRWYASVHLTYLREDAPMRMRQLDEIRGLLAGLEPLDRRPVVGGDCNMLPDEAEHRHALDIGFVDLWGDRRGTVDEITMTSANPHLPGSDERFRARENAVTTGDEAGFCLDYLFTVGHGGWSSIDHRVIGRRPPGETWASDHLGLCFDLPDRTAGE